MCLCEDPGHLKNNQLKLTCIYNGTGKTAKDSIQDFILFFLGNSVEIPFDTMDQCEGLCEFGVELTHRR